MNLLEIFQVKFGEYHKLKGIKYQYAEKISGELVHINAINKTLSHEKYFCIDCKEELIPKLGDIRIHHFSHKKDTYNCSKETYLHILGKRIFYETYLYCLENNIPFYFYASLYNSLSATCKYYEYLRSQDCIIKGINKVDLTKIFDFIEYEKSQEKFRPDLTLKNNYGDKIFIEISVTHPCEKEKIESKNKIIEIAIKEEADIRVILDKNLSEEDDNITYYNFDDFNIYTEPVCKENTLSKYFVILKTGEQFSTQFMKRDLCKFIHDNLNFIAKIIPIRPIVPPVFSRNINRGGPRINEIESRMNRKNNSNMYKPRRRK